MNDADNQPNSNPPVEGQNTDWNSSQTDANQVTQNGQFGEDQTETVETYGPDPIDYGVDFDEQPAVVSDAQTNQVAVEGINVTPEASFGPAPMNTPSEYGQNQPQSGAIEQPVYGSAPEIAQPQPVQAPASAPNPNGYAPTPTLQPFEPAVPVLGGVPVQPSSKKKWLPLAIVGGALMLLGGSASAYYVGVYQNSDKVLFDAYNNLLSAKHIQMDGITTVDMDSLFGFKLESIELASKADTSPGMAMDVKVKMVVMSEDITVGGKAMYTSNGDLYFQMNGLRDAMKSTESIRGGQAMDYSAFDPIENQWVKITPAYIKEQDEASGKQYQCFVGTLAKHKDKRIDPDMALFKKNQFITKEEDLGSKDGRIGYKLKLDEVKFKDYLKSLEETGAVKDMKKCTDSTEDLLDDSTIPTDRDSKVTVNVWIDRWSHKLEVVEQTSSTSGSDFKLSTTGKYNIAYDDKIAVKAPEGSITFEEFMRRYEAAAKSMSASVTVPTNLEFEDGDNLYNRL